jgi:hypothetical protein
VLRHVIRRILTSPVLEQPRRLRRHLPLVIRGPSPILLPDRGGRDRDLARRGRLGTGGGRGQDLDHIRGANKEANPELMRIALKLATGVGKTTVMVMLIAWQTVNAVRRSGSSHFFATTAEDTVTKVRGFEHNVAGSLRARQFPRLAP